MLQTFRISVVPSDGSCTLILTGEADLAVADDIVELGTAALNDPTTHTLLVDMSAVTFMDSSAISALITLRNLAVGPDKKLILVGPPPRVTRTLELVGLGGVFNIV